jgi:hypothetical protein
MLSLPTKRIKTINLKKSLKRHLKPVQAVFVDKICVISHNFCIADTCSLHWS